MVTLKTAQTVASMKDIKIQQRELVEDWLLITYDIPCTEEGSIARSKFLKTAPKIGAMMHSKSVYLMPNTQQAQLAAVDLSGTVGGEVYIWTSKVEGEQAKTITSFYDRKITEGIEKIEHRIKKEQELILKEKYGMADRMRRKSQNLFSQLLFAVAQRGADAKVVQKLTTIENKLTKETEEK